MKRTASLVVCLCIVGAASPASALMLYGVSHDEAIWQVDRSNGTITLYKNTPGIEWFGATDGPSQNVFFATSEGGSLFQVDVAADTITPIGSYGGSLKIKSLAYAEPELPTVAGVLYASDYQKLYSIDVNTGVATLIGPVVGGAGDIFIGVWSMDYDPVAKVLFVVNQVATTSKLYSVNPANGAATLVGEISGGAVSPEALADIWYDHDSGKMLGISQVTGQLYEVNTATAQVTAIGTAPGDNILGLGGAMIPEPGMLMLLGLGLLGLLPTARRHRR